MSDLARRVTSDVAFNGANVSTVLRDYLRSVSYTDVADGSSDSIKISLQNIDMKWLSEWYPEKGDQVTATLIYHDWKKTGDLQRLECGLFILDDISFSGGPLVADFGATSVPLDNAFKSQERTKTWENVTIQQIGSSITETYGLGFVYDADTITIEAVEQSDKTDSAFLYEIAKDYGLAMKVYWNKIIMYDKGRYEAKDAVAQIGPRDFIDGQFEYNDTLDGTYTGATFSYKNGTDSEEIEAAIGVTEGDGARPLKISSKADDLLEARIKAAAQVNRSNEKVTTLSFGIFPDPSIVATSCIEVVDMGRMSGKYFVDSVETEHSPEGTSQSLKLHRVVERVSA